MVRLSVLSLFSYLLSVSTGITCPSQVYESACSIGGVKFIGRRRCDGVVFRHVVSTEPEIELRPSSHFAAPNMYTLVLLDVDFSYVRIPGRSYLMWLVTNIRIAENNPPKFDMDSGTAVAEYRPTHFAYNNGVHRIVLLIFQHKTPNSFISTPVYDFNRSFFNLSRWLFWYRHYLICVPVAGGQVRTY